MTKRYCKYAQTHRTVRGRKQKYCTKCKKWKSESTSEFRQDRARKDGLRIYCKECDNAYQQEYKRKHRGKAREYLKFEQRHRIVKGLRQKLCSHCKDWKDESDFYRNRNAKDGLAGRCRECAMGRTGKHPWKGRQRGRRNLSYEQRHRVVAGVKQKLCGRCDQWKAQSDFHRNRSTRDGLGFRCKECDKKGARERYGRKKGSARENLRYDERHRIVDGVREKLCTMCQNWKRESEYYRCKSSRDGLSVRCKICSYNVAAKSGK